MENIVVILIPALLGLFLVRMLLLPMKLVFKLLLHAGCGFLCLWVLNTASGFTGIYMPINAVTIAVAGLLGLPGIALLALLELGA